MDSRRYDLPSETTTEETVELVESLSRDEGIDGILVQHPMPAHVDERAVFEAVAPTKDVDGVTNTSFARIALDQPGFASCTPGGIMRILSAYDVDAAGQRAVVVGRSPIVGKPVGMLLLARNATVTYCHSRTQRLPDEVGQADILIAAVGRPELIKGHWIKPGAVANPAA